MDQEGLRRVIAEGRLRWRQHALQRMMQRGIAREQVYVITAYEPGLDRFEPDFRTRRRR